MIIIGIDPGTIHTGYGIINFTSNEFVHIKSGVISPPLNYALSNKLAVLFDALDNLIKTYKPDAFALETSFYGKNVQSTLKIGYVRGIALLAAAKNDLLPGEYSPREIKKSVVGRGSATKEQVQFMVRKLANLKTDKMKFDESDAIATAICHAFKMNSVSTKSGSWKSFVKNNPQKVIDG